MAGKVFLGVFHQMEALDVALQHVKNNDDAMQVVRAFLPLIEQNMCNALFDDIDIEELTNERAK